MEIVTHFLYQVVFSFGMILLFGLLIALCRKGFCRLAGRVGPKVLLVTGLVGTPIHELSHALMCLIFGHKIVKIRLYQPNSTDGTLGYVNHSFHPRNLYHQIGNFFIGVAPILGGSGVLLLLMYLLVPGMYHFVAGRLALSTPLPADLPLLPAVWAYVRLLWQFFKGTFSLAHFKNLRWWIYMVLALMIAGHMELSREDVKSGLKGLGFLLGILLAVDIVVGLISLSVLAKVTSAILTFSLFMVEFLTISVFFSLLMLLIALLCRGLGRLFGK